MQVQINERVVEVDKKIINASGAERLKLYRSDLIFSSRFYLKRLNHTGQSFQ